MPLPSFVPPAGIYHCLQGIRSFIPWTHPCIRMTEAQPALIRLPPCSKPRIRLQGIQTAPTTRQKLRRDAQHQAAQQHHKHQQGRLQAAVQRWPKKQQARGLQDGPESPFVMLSYADKYTKVIRSVTRFYAKAQSRVVLARLWALNVCWQAGLPASSASQTPQGSTVDRTFPASTQCHRPPHAVTQHHCCAACYADCRLWHLPHL